MPKKTVDFKELKRNLLSGDSVVWSERMAHMFTEDREIQIKIESNYDIELFQNGDIPFNYLAPITPNSNSTDYKKILMFPILVTLEENEFYVFVGEIDTTTRLAHINPLYAELAEAEDFAGTREKPRMFYEIPTTMHPAKVSACNGYLRPKHCNLAVAVVHLVDFLIEVNLVNEVIEPVAIDKIGTPFENVHVLSFEGISSSIDGTKKKRLLTEEQFKVFFIPKEDDSTTVELYSTVFCRVVATLEEKDCALITFEHDGKTNTLPLHRFLDTYVYFS